ncbi:hypothetical protein [Naasia sp. SYSU D00948]|uniref:hypothetical protein n=1 Tax=Naasia sp. SYSU D00948 TaxID=2817379 RepID=UPI001B30E034|nr:hypothetical protein [Naasia sp. SYSU D00948]
MARGTKWRSVSARIRRAPEWAMVLGVAVGAALIGLAATFRGPFFFYVGDAPESFVPLWSHFGRQLLAGQWPLMEASGWMGGNYAGEAAYAQFNPILLADYVLVSLFDDLAWASAFVMIEMLALLAVGSYLLAREYGARREYAAAASALAIPFSGFTLFYEAAGWPAGLAAFVGVTWFWWGLKRQMRGRQNLFVTVVIGMLAITTGNPYATLGVLIVLLGVFVEELVHRRVASALRLVVTGALVGGSVLLVFLPLLGVQSVTNRQELAAIVNDTFMVPDLGDLAASSNPTYLPSITNWGGQLVEALPSVYLAWFALPLLPWIRWKAAARRLRGAVSLAVIGGLYALATLGPSNLWLFRWPLRLIEYTYLAALVLLAVALSCGIARTRRRMRFGASAAIIAVGVYLGLAVRPESSEKQMVGALVTAVLIGALLAVARKASASAVAATMAAGTLVVVVMQVAFFPSLADPTARPAHDIPAMRANTADYSGTVLQIASQGSFVPRQNPDPESLILWGNLPAAVGFESITRYSGISFRDFSNALCMDYKGQTCPEVMDRLLEPVDGTDRTLLLDALRISTIVVEKDNFAPVIRSGPPEGWSVVGEDEVREIWRRDAPLPFPGRVSAVTDGLTVTGSAATETSERVDLQAPSGGTVTFARLAWPGYTARVDGSPVDVERTDEGLVQIEVPAGAQRLELTYATPGVLVGGAATVAALLAAAVLGLVWRRRRGGNTPAAEDTSRAAAVPVAEGELVPTR